MSRSVVWFVAGMLCAALIGASVFAVSQHAEGSETENTWQVRQFLDFDFGGHGRDDEYSMPEIYIDDFVRQLPASCDFQVLAEQRAVYYRCPVDDLPAMPTPD